VKDAQARAIGERGEEGSGLLERLARGHVALHPRDQLFLEAGNVAEVTAACGVTAAPLDLQTHA
jgi:hypothetical protein